MFSLRLPLLFLLCLASWQALGGPTGKVGMPLTEPWSYYAKAGGHHFVPTGILLDINQALERESGISLRPSLQPYFRLDRDLRQGDCDLAYVIRSDEQEGYVEYLAPLFSFEAVALARPGTPLRNRDDLRNLRVGVIKDTHLLPGNGDGGAFTRLEVRDYEALVDMFLAGRLDAIVGGGLSLNYHLRKRGLGPASFTRLSLQRQEVWVVLAKQSPLQRQAPKLRQAVERLREQGIIEEVLQRRLSPIAAELAAR